MSKTNRAGERNTEHSNWGEVTAIQGSAIVSKGAASQQHQLIAGEFIHCNDTLQLFQ